VRLYEKIRVIFIKFKNSLNTLKECYSDMVKAEDEKIKLYIQDSCIKRFEHTYEIAKKIMNKYLKKEYDKAEKDLTINNIFREMYGLNLIENFENWTEYRLKRNITSHEYDLDKSGEILAIVPDFIADTKYLIDSLEKVLVDD